MAIPVEFSSKRYYTNECMEGEDDSNNSKKGKMLSDDGDDFSFVGSQNDDILSQVDSNLDKSFEEVQSISSAVLETKEPDEVTELVQLLREGVSCLNEDVVVVNETMTNLNRKISDQQKQINMLQQLVQQAIEMNKALQVRNRTLQDELVTMQINTSAASVGSSLDGTYLWKITDFTQKLIDAIAEKQTSIYSPPFYSSPNGYKMCMRLYLQGDGQARRTHLSLFFVLLRGENDAILPWPFNHRVLFCLFDQSRNQRHVIDSFRPDPSSNSFQRPRSAMNIASGIPKFFPLHAIQQSNNPYVRDDCMFIRCIVDFDSIPKAALQTACTLNLSLPLLNRNKQIHEEIDRANATKTDRIGQQERIAEEELTPRLARTAIPTEALMDS